MTEYVEVSTQAELEEALAREGVIPVCVGTGSFAVTKGLPVIVARESSSPRIVTWDSSSPRIVAWATSSPRIEARNASTPRVLARESSSPLVLARDSSSARVLAWAFSSPRVLAWETASPVVVSFGPSSPVVVAWECSSPRVEAFMYSSPRVEARGSSSPTVVAWDTATPTIVARESSSPRVLAWEASAPTGSVRDNAVLVASRHGDRAKVEIEGATLIDVPRIESASQWCDYHGVQVEGGVATLYKALDGEYRSSRNGFQYLPGAKPEAPDWDGGESECGGGLHFAPHPAIALQWFPDATRFVACPVELSEIVVHEPADYPQKVKAPRVCEPVYEVDADGNPVETR